MSSGLRFAAIQGLYELVVSQQAEIDRMRRAMADAGLAVEP